MKNDNKNYFIHSNELVKSFKNEMQNVGELKAFYTLCSLFYHERYTNPTTTETRVNVKALLECMGYSVNGDNPKEYIKHLKSLREHAFFTTQDEKYQDYEKILPCFHISVPKGWQQGVNTKIEDVIFTWEKRFIPFITNQYDEEGNQVGNYTLMLLQAIVPLRSKPAQELYIQMSRISGLDYPTVFSVDEIRNMLGMTAPSYQATKEVTRNLKEYIADVNKNTNIKINYHIVADAKDKRKTSGYSFKVKNNDVKSNIYFSGCPDVYITQQDYINLTKDKSGSDIALLKRKANELQELINPKQEGHTPQPIKNHYVWLKTHTNITLDEDNENKSRRTAKNKLSGEPNFDLNEINRRAMFNDNFDI